MGLMRVEKSIISFSRRNGCFASTIWSKSSCSVERSMREVFSDGFCIKYVRTRATMEIFYHISLYYFLWRSRSFGNSPIETAQVDKVLEDSEIDENPSQNKGRNESVFSRARRSRGERAVSRYGESERQVVAEKKRSQSPSIVLFLFIAVYFEMGSSIIRILVCLSQ